MEPRIKYAEPPIGFVLRSWVVFVTRAIAAFVVIYALYQYRNTHPEYTIFLLCVACLYGGTR